LTARSATLAVSVAASVTLAALATIPVRADTAQDVKSAKGRLTALQDRLDGLAARYDQAQARYAGIESQMAGVQARIAVLRDRVAAVQGGACSSGHARPTRAAEEGPRSICCCPRIRSPSSRTACSS
jgi:hypothetical protein